MSPENSLESARALSEEAVERLGSIKRSFKGLDLKGTRELVEELSLTIKGLLGEVERLKEELRRERESHTELSELSEQELSDLLGKETGRILSSAREAARDMLEEARARAQEILRSAEEVLAQRAAEADAVAEQIKSEAEQEAAEIVASAREEARQLEAKLERVRERIVTELSDRRRTLREQVERLLAARDSIVATLAEAAARASEAIQGLENAEERAREASVEALRTTKLHEPAIEELLEKAATEEVPLVKESSLAPATEEEPSSFKQASEQAEEAEAYEGIRILGAVRASSLLRQQEAEEVEDEVGHAAQEPDEEIEIPDEGDPGETPGAEEPRREVAGFIEETEQRLGSIFARLRSREAEAKEAVEEGVGAPDRPQAEEEEEALEEEREISALASQMARKVKIVLSELQNDLTERLREGKGATPSELMEEPALSDRIVRATKGYFESAYLLGAGEKGGGTGAFEASETFAVRFANQLVGEVEGAISDADASEVEKRLAATIRSLKAERVEQLAVEAAMEAHSRGVLDSVGRGGRVVWVMGSERCPECEDNSLANVTVGSEVFPTGHLHPPAHAGCRCVLRRGS